MLPIVRRLAALPAAIAFLLLLAAPAAAASGSATKTETTYSSVKRIVWEWTSGTDAEDGTVTSQTTATFDGELLGLTTIPGTGGDQPTNLYDITVTDEDGYDVLLGAGADRSNAATEHVVKTSLAAVARSKLTLNVAAAGTAKKGTVVLYVR